MMKIDERVIEIINESNGFEKLALRIGGLLERKKLQLKLVYHNDYSVIEKIEYIDEINDLLRQ